MNDPQIASEFLVQNQMSKQPLCVLPNKTVQTFLLELIEQSNFPGRMAEFVGDVKSLLRDAALSDK